MSVAKLQSDGLISLPKDVQEALHVTSGDSLEIVVRNGAIVMTPLDRPNTKPYQKESTEDDFMQFLGSMKGTFGDPELATKEIRKERDASSQ